MTTLSHSDRFRFPKGQERGNRGPSPVILIGKCRFFYHYLAQMANNDGVWAEP